MVGDDHDLEDDYGRPHQAGPLSWAPKPITVAAAVLGAIVLAAGSFSYSDDVVGRGLLGIAAVLLVAVAVVGGVARPRLRVLAPSGPDPRPRLAIRTLTRRRVYGMDQLYRVRVVRYPRLGRRVPILEIDARRPVEKLELLSRWDLGTSPDRVFEALRGAGAVPPEPTGP